MNWIDAPLRIAFVEGFAGFQDLAGVGFGPAAEILYLVFKEGDIVHKGDLLFQIDPRPYQDAYDQAVGQLKQAQANKQLQDATFERQDHLRQTGGIAKEDYDTAVSNKSQAAAQVVSAQAAVNSAQLNLEFTHVTSPIDGRASRQLVNIGNLVQADSTQLTTVVSIDPIYAYFSVDELAALTYQRLVQEGKFASTQDGKVPEAMDEVGGAVISIAVVLTAVFVPTALVSGISGQFYRQFALTIAIATLISAFNSLTLSPALAALLIRPGHAKKDLFTRLIDIFLGWFFRLFNRTFDWGVAGYGAVVRRLLRVSGLVLVVYVGLLALTGLIFQKVPTGFIPTMDQGYLIVFAQLPDGASLQRNDDVRRQIGEIGRNIPGVELTFAIEGLSILDSTIKSNALTVFFPLKPFSERIGHPEQSATAIVGKLQAAFSSIQDAFVVAIQPPSVRGLGNAGGFQLEIEDRRNSGLNALQQATDAVTAAANTEPGLSAVFTTYRAQVPQLFLNIDREKVQTLDVPIASVFDSLQTYLGTNYVNDFNFLGRTYQVNVQADAPFRADPNQILRMYTRNNSGGMVPLGSMMDIKRVTGPDTVSHYNVYPAALIQGRITIFSRRSVLSFSSDWRARTRS